MSSDETQSALSRAYELVETGNYSEAQAIVDPILATNKDNADAWWIYAHAVTDPEAGREALENVMRINPQYPGASELLAQARQRFGARPKITSLARPVTVPEAPPTLPEVGVPEAARDARERAGARQPRRSTLPLVAVLVVIIVVAAAVILLTQNGAAPTSTATAVAIAQATETETVGGVAATEATAATEAALSAPESTANATAAVEPTMGPAAVTTEAATIEAVTTEAATTGTVAVTTPETVGAQPTPAVTVEATASVEAVAATAQSAAETFALIEQSLTAFPVAESGVGQVETSLGNTLMVTVCTTPGRAMRSLLPQVMNALALKSPTLGTSVEAIGVRMLDCSANSPLLTVAIELATAQRFASGAISSSDFAASWQPQ